MDVKLGRVTWTDTKSPEKQESQRKKVASTTTGSIGLRISGMVIKDNEGNTIESWSKEGGYFNVTADNIHE